MKASTTLRNKVNAVDQIVDSLKKNMDDLIVNDALLRRIHDHSDIIPTFANSVEGHGFGVIQRGLISLQVLAIVRCYDKRRQNRASLPHVIELLKDAETFDAITYRARNWLPDSAFADRSQRTARENLTFAIREYERYMAIEDFQKWLTALRHHRNDHLAHSLFDTGPRERALFGYISDVMRETFPVVAALQLGVLGHNWDPEQSVHVWNKYADAFWRRTIPLRP